MDWVVLLYWSACLPAATVNPYVAVVCHRFVFLGRRHVHFVQLLTLLQSRSVSVPHWQFCSWSMCRFLSTSFILDLCVASCQRLVVHSFKPKEPSCLVGLFFVVCVSDEGFLVPRGLLQFLLTPLTQRSLFWFVVILKVPVLGSQCRMSSVFSCRKWSRSRCFKHGLRCLETPHHFSIREVFLSQSFTPFTCGNILLRLTSLGIGLAKFLRTHSKLCRY